MKNEIDLSQNYIRQHGKEKREYYPSSYHFMPETGWVNDPNGVCYFRGEYHLFYQYNPFDTVWRAPYWGHAVTKDFINYKYLPAALAPSESPAFGCFSGGAVTDGDKLYLCYTRHFDLENSYREEQFLAASSDGISFECNNEPILTQKHLGEGDSKQDFRDPNPVKIDGAYYVFVGNKTEDGIGQMQVFKSKDMQSFEYHMTIRHESFGSMLECPDVFRYDGKDVVVFSSLGYGLSNSPNGEKHGSYALIGNIDYVNKTYNFEKLVKLDYGTDFYAPQTLEAPDGRRVMFAWLDLWNNSKHMQEIKNNTSGRYALPRELIFKDNDLFIRPVREVYGFMGDSVEVSEGNALQKNVYVKANFENNSVISLAGEGGSVEIERKDGRIYLNSKQKNHLDFTSGVDCGDGECQLEIFSDAGSLEVFCSNGKVLSLQVLIPSDLVVDKMKGVSVVEAKQVNQNK